MASELQLSEVLVDAAIRDRVSIALADSDQMFKGNHKHYASVGVSGLAAICNAMDIVGVSAVKRILDFGAGAGRVTRWMRAAFPEASIVAADLRKNDLEFCAREFASAPWVTDTDLGNLNAPHSFDLIWAGSVATHLPEAATRHLMARFAEWLEPGGLFFVTLHGPYAHSRTLEGRDYGVTPEGKTKILKGYAETGYGFADYPKQTGYGISINTPEWAKATVSDMPHCRFVSYVERGWDNHQDVLAVQKSR